MTQELLDSLVGKTIESVVLLEPEVVADTVHITFTDGTVAVIETSEWISDIKLKDRAHFD